MSSLESEQFPDPLKKPTRAEPKTDEELAAKDKKMIVRTRLAQTSGNGSTDMHSKIGKQTIAMHKIFSILVDPSKSKLKRETEKHN